MSSSSPVSDPLKPLEPASLADAGQFTPEVRAQLKSIADPYRDNRGRTLLFTGAPGSGKTLAARFLAGQLGYNIYRADLAALTSKYIGETEKNLSRLLNMDSAPGFILFFDEADSLFGKRSEVSSSNDRYANEDTNYLLQRIEGFKGIVILASSSRNDLDDAVLGRVTSVVEFTRSTAKRRSPWWERIREWLTPPS